MTTPVLPDYTRWQWASQAERLWWRPLLQEAEAAFKQLELLAVVDGLRPAAWQFVPHDELVPRSIWAQEHGLVALPTAHTFLGNSYSSSGGNGNANSYRVVFTTPDRAKDVYPWTDDDKIGELLGFPACCRKAFADTWGKGQVDSTWEQFSHPDRLAANGPAFRPAHTMLRWMGIRYVPHMPCHIDCHASTQLAINFHILGGKFGYGDEMRTITEVLKWPIAWSRLFGNAEITTPALRIFTRSDWTAAKQEFCLPGTYNKPDATLWTDNGFSDPTPMRQAHKVLLATLKDYADQNDRVMDLGCGNGLLLRKFKQTTPGVKIAGIDTDAAVIGRIPVLTGKWFVDAIESGEWGGWTPSVVLLNPGRVLEMEPEQARRVRYWLSHVPTIILYAYPDWTTTESLESLAAKAGFAMTPLHKTPAVSVGLVTNS
jgi:hypothetical protein